MTYTPKISQGYYPEDAGWATIPSGENVLMLCIPEYAHLITLQVKNFDYTWLFNFELDAYIFCFRVNNQFEHAVIFKKEHAGILLFEEQAFEKFNIGITGKPFEELTEKDPVFMLNDIEMVRHGDADW